MIAASASEYPPRHGSAFAFCRLVLETVRRSWGGTCAPCVARSVDDDVLEGGDRRSGASDSCCVDREAKEPLVEPSLYCCRREPSFPSISASFLRRVPMTAIRWMSLS